MQTTMQAPHLLLLPIHTQTESAVHICALSQEPFNLVRTAKKSKSSLTLIVGGQDVTRQDQRLTEAELESRFTASLLPRTLVFTQEDLLELLQVCLCV